MYDIGLDTRMTLESLVEEALKEGKHYVRSADVRLTIENNQVKIRENEESKI